VRARPIGPWKLKNYAPDEGLSDGASGADVDTSDCVDIDAPGDVHQALIAGGRIAGPWPPS
jgi:hypothetical protein